LPILGTKRKNLAEWFGRRQRGIRFERPVSAFRYRFCYRAGRGLINLGEDAVKPFTIIAAILLLVVAVAHAYRAYYGLDLVFASHVIPIYASWVCAAVTAFLGLMLFVERGK